LRPDEIRLPYESSRGCWWGAKHHCTFCGLNALGIGYREKKPEKVLDEIGGLVATHPAATIVMVDNIMPFSYFETLIPELARRQPRLKLFYEQKANLSFARMQMLADAGVRWIQPGIEALDTSLLKLMRKGSSLRSNLDCLRFARGLAIHVSWNLLVDFPGDEDAPYEAMGRIVPYLFHLQPPSGVTPLSIERFSPYFDEAADFEIANIRPIADYELAFPGADLDRLAYHFVGDYASAYRRRPDLVENLAAQVGLWQQVWEAPDSVPVLEIIRLADDRYLICDTRPVAIVPAEIIGMARARLCLTGAGGDEADANWAIERVYVWPADGLLLPLATADEACMTRFLVPGVLPQAIPSPRPVDEAPGTTDVRLAPTRELRPTG
jgi:ribosomal peptide maturation radical SAM protein 1